MKKRDRTGGKGPAELAVFEGDIIRAGKKSTLFFDIWPQPDAFEARARPNIDLLSPTRFANGRNEKRARQAEVFDAMPDLTAPCRLKLREAMGSVKWIQKVYTSAAGTQKSHLVDSAKKHFLLCLPEHLRHLPLHDLQGLAEHPDAMSLRSTPDDPMPPFVSPPEYADDHHYIMRSPILVKLFIVCMISKSGLTAGRVRKSKAAGSTGQSKATAKSSGGNKSKADMWDAVGVIRPEFMAFSFVMCRFVLSGDETFTPKGSYDYQGDYNFWKKELIMRWHEPEMKETRRWWKACVWNGHDLDNLHFDGPQLDKALTPAQARAQALFAKMGQQPRVSAEESVSSPPTHATISATHSSLAPSAGPPLPSIAGAAVPSHPSAPALPSHPSASALPSHPSAPAPPSHPSAPAAPSRPSAPAVSLHLPASASSTTSGRSRISTQAAPMPIPSAPDESEIDTLETGVAAMTVRAPTPGPATEVADTLQGPRDPTPAPEPEPPAKQKAKAPAKGKPKKKVAPEAAEPDVERVAPPKAKAQPSKPTSARAGSARLRAASEQAAEDSEEEPPLATKAKTKVMRRSARANARAADK